MSDAVSSSLLWGTIIIMSIIIGVWSIERMQPIQQELSRIDVDLQNLAGITSEACNSYTYQRRYNPITEYGEIRFENYTICIEQLCTYSICDLSIHTSHRLENMTHAIIEKDEDRYDVRFE